MSTFASQLILHPVVSQTLKVWSTTLGRDKTYRALQYFARFLAWYLIARGQHAPAAKYNALKSHLALARKLMRIGKPMEHLQAALRAAQSTGPPAEQILTIARQLGYFAYLVYDALVWAHAVKVIAFAPETAAKVNKRANQFWFFGILFSLLHGITKGSRLTSEARELKKSRTWGEKGSESERHQTAHALKTSSRAVQHQFTMDILDIWIPATNIGLVTFNDGILGIFGFITSVMAFRQQWTAVASTNKAS